MPSGRLVKLLAALVPALMLGAVALAFALIRGRPLEIARIFGLASLVAVLSWIVASVLWPGRSDRRCPSCGAEALVRRDPNTTVGIVCSRCGFVDEEASAWLLAEEEGPLERTVLEQRARDSRRRRAPDVDIPGVPD
jgi:hypothetical protein